jgi:DNA polymerase I
MSKPLILIDGSSYFYRAFHALPPLSNSKGQPTGAVYGVVNMVNKLIKDYSSQHLAVIFDAKGKTFRDELYPDYKANREAMPDELSSQFQPLVDIIAAKGIPILTVDGVEADDVIGTLVVQAQQQGISTLISTGDKDFAQLVNEHVTLINTMSNTVLDTKGVVEKFGVHPDQIIDYLTLIGDKVDNIPGVDKVGPKTAVKWLATYHSLDNLLAHADEIPGKVGENLRNSRATLPLSKKLITIKTDLQLNCNIKDLCLQEEDTPRLIKLYQEMEFRTWLDQLLPKKPEIPKDYDVIKTLAQLDHWIEKIQQAGCFAIDTETTSLNALDAKLVGLSMAVEPNQAAYLPLAHDDEPEQLDRDTVLSKLKPILTDAALKKIGQNLKYDCQIFKNYNITLAGITYDTMLESYVLNSAASRHDMDSLALKYLGKNTIRFEDIAGKGVKQKTFNQIPVSEAAPYAAEDADITLQLHQTLWPKLCATGKLQAVFETIEMPLLSVLTKMEAHGVKIDNTLLQTLSQQLAERIETLADQAYLLSGSVFNLNSTQQLQAILFTHLKLPILKKTPKGQPSTAEAVLHELSHEYELPKIILEYRSLSKLKSTYADALPKKINPRTQRIHTSYNQAVTATGRLSSTEPNLQNIPIRTTEGRKIRAAFITEPGYKILAADYSQIELRIMAHLSQDKALCDAFAKGLDIHAATAADVFGTTVENVTPLERRRAKAINFGLIYGMSAFGLARQLETEHAAAQAYIDLYFNRFPGVKHYMETTRQKAHEQGFVETVFGRRLYLPEINARNITRQKAAERTAINAPLQGTAADIIKLAMIQVDQALAEQQIDAVMIMQVHDELVFEVNTEHTDKLSTLLHQIMCHTVELSVPLTVDIGIGNNWDEAH